ncbi:MAG: hypothetical protein M3Y64_11800 [Gemmatimonadota bacterium]|nr:hypothetical protein [Gemmatimonadota bacterium]
MHHIIQQLNTFDASFPTERKLLLVPNINLGRELLAALALQNGGWVGWEVATLGSVAERLALIDLAERRLRRARDVALDDVVSSAFDEAIAAGELQPGLAGLDWSAGTRSAVTDAVLELRTAGVAPEFLQAVGASRSTDSAGLLARSLAPLLRRYERLLADRSLADPTAQFAAALRAFDEQRPFVLDHALMLCTPGWVVRGKPRSLFDRLVEAGLRCLLPVSSA